MNGVCYTFNLNYQASEDVFKMIGSGQLHKVAIEFNIESKWNLNEVNNTGLIYMTIFQIKETCTWKMDLQVVKEYLLQLMNKELYQKYYLVGRCKA